MNYIILTVLYIFYSINPITGSYETPRPNPLENMSEEQKEYEAIKLINMIDQLQRFVFN